MRRESFLVIRLAKSTRGGLEEGVSRGRFGAFSRIFDPERISLTRKFNSFFSSFGFHKTHLVAGLPVSTSSFGR